jgi:hypothetical protein
MTTGECAHCAGQRSSRGCQCEGDCGARPDAAGGGTFCPRAEGYLMHLALTGNYSMQDIIALQKRGFR